MDTNSTKESELNDLSKNYLESLRESILEFETQACLNNDNKDVNKQSLITPDFNGLINILSQIKNLSSEGNLQEIVKLSESTCVFLNYIKDSRFNYQDEKIRETMKYIIHSFKALFLNERKEDFELFVKYLNNPADIFIK